jgi:hypothetical protein
LEIREDKQFGTGISMWRLATVGEAEQITSPIRMTEKYGRERVMEFLELVLDWD